MFDLSKKFLHVEDNEDGTITFTFSLGDSFDGTLKDATIVQQGTLEQLVAEMAANVTPEQFSYFDKTAIFIPNEVP